jgi:hypothetical protein
MTVGAVSAHIGAVGIGVRRVSAETSVYLRMARKIHEDAGEATGVEIHRNRISVCCFVDSGAVRQHVQAGKAENLEPCGRPDPPRLPLLIRWKSRETQPQSPAEGRHDVRS